MSGVRKDWVKNFDAYPMESHAVLKKRDIPWMIGIFAFFSYQLM